MLTENEKNKLLEEMIPVIRFKVNEFYNRGYIMEDLMQEALMNVYKALDRFDKTKASISTYVQVIVINCLNDYTRKSNNYLKHNISNEEIVYQTAYDTHSEYNDYYLRLDELFKDNLHSFSKLEIAFIEELLERKTFQEIENDLDITPNHRAYLCHKIKTKLIALKNGER